MSDLGPDAADPAHPAPLDPALAAFQSVLDEENFTATWILFKDHLNNPWRRLIFTPDGAIQGGTATEARWQLSDGIFSIATSTGVLAACFDVLAAKNPMHLEGADPQTGSRYLLRRTGFLTPTRTGPYGTPTTTDQSFYTAFLSGEDFSHRAFPSGHVGPARPTSFHFDTGSAAVDLTAHQHFDPFPRYAAPAAHFHVLHECDLVGGTVVVDRDGRPLFDTTYQAELRSRRAASSICEVDDRSAVLMNRYLPDETIPGTTIAFNTLWDNFGHWHTQALPSLYIIDLLHRLGLTTSEPLNILLLGGTSHEPFRAESLKLLGLGDVRFLDPAADASRGILDLHFDRLVVPSILRIPHGETWNPGLMTYFRDRLAGSIEKPATRTRRLFVSRNDVAGRRGLINEAEVFARLEPLGFESFLPTRHSYREQLAAFAEAQCVVSPHGGALTSLLAADAGLIVFELFHTRQLNNWYRNLAFLCGHEYHGVCGTPVDPPSTAHWNSAFHLDADSLARSIASALNWK